MIETSCNATLWAETAFSFKLHIVLDQSEKQGFDDVISWQGNNAFMVHKPKKFESSIMKEYFNQTLYKNFQKQLEIHGFKRIAVGERFGGSYTHSLLIRGQPNMSQFMIKTPKLKRAKLGRGSSAPLPQSRSRSDSNSTSRSRSCSTDLTLRRKFATEVSSSTSTLAIEDDLEPLPHTEEIVPIVIECCDHDRRSNKKHRSNNSWSPIYNLSEDSVAVSDWLSSAFGGDEDQEIFHKIIDVEDDDDTHSIHSFSSLPMTDEIEVALA